MPEHAALPKQPWRMVYIWHDTVVGTLYVIDEQADPGPHPSSLKASWVPALLNSRRNMSPEQREVVGLAAFPWQPLIVTTRPGHAKKEQVAKLEESELVPETL